MLEIPGSDKFNVLFVVFFTSMTDSLEDGFSCATVVDNKNTKINKMTGTNRNEYVFIGINI